MPGLDPDGCAGKDYLGCWNKYWAWTQTPEFKQQMRDIVLAPDFLDDNYLSAEFRVPVTLLQTNACSPLATNAIGGNIWDNFSSQSYKDLPSVGEITWYHPYTGEPRTYTMPAGGRGYTRPPSLVSLWSTAPFLLNNTVGRFEASPSVEARHAIVPGFDRPDALAGGARQGLAARRQDSRRHRPRRRSAPAGHGTQPVYLKVGAGYLPEFLQKTLTAQRTLFPALFSDEGVRLGPIPPGTPIGLLANLNLLSDDPDPLTASRSMREKVARRWWSRSWRGCTRSAATPRTSRPRAVFTDLVEPLLEVSKCPDFIVNRGHLFGTDVAGRRQARADRVPENVLMPG